MRCTRIMALVGSLAVTILLPAAQPARAGDLAEVKARGKLLMITYPVQSTHFVSIKLDVLRDSGLKLTDLRRPEQFAGIDVELMNGFARSLGVELEIRPVADGYGALIPALDRRDGDLIASELTITPQRQAKADFSLPYVSNWIAVVVRRDSHIATPADLRNARGAVLRGSSHPEFLNAAVPGVHLQTTSFDLESLEAVANGSVDFALMDTGAPPGQSVDTMHPGLKVAFRLREIGDGIAVRKGSDLLAPLNAYLEKMKSSGVLRSILERNGFPAAASTPSSSPTALSAPALVAPPPHGHC
jgi:ABC-type amino acid transport substrate-binding protein